MDGTIADLANKSRHRTLGVWAADCAMRVLHYFEEKYPQDHRPRKAVEALLAWVGTGVFKMDDVRGYSLSAHAAAREVKDEDEAARAAARSAGQAMATAHVPAHAVAAAIYAASAVRDAAGSIDEALSERHWQYRHLLELNDAAGAAPSMEQKLWRGGRE